jgi:hypothetical protein
MIQCGSGRVVLTAALAVLPSGVYHCACECGNDLCARMRKSNELAILCFTCEKAPKNIKGVPSKIHKILLVKISHEVSCHFRTEPRLVTSCGEAKGMGYRAATVHRVIFQIKVGRFSIPLFYQIMLNHI